MKCEISSCVFYLQGKCDLCSDTTISKMGVCEFRFFIIMAKEFIKSDRVYTILTRSQRKQKLQQGPLGWPLP